jgi:hypothetical protein
MLAEHEAGPGEGNGSQRAKGGVMAEIDGILSELRHRIMGPFEPPKPATQEVDSRVKHSAVVARRRLSHPERDGTIVVEDDPPTEPINPRRGDDVVVGDDPISPLIRRLSLDMPELMEEVVAFIERRTAELNGNVGAAPPPRERVAPAALVRAAPTPEDDDAGKTAITLLFDTRVLARIDADAKRLGISRTAWLHVSAGEWLQGRR